MGGKGSAAVKAEESASEVVVIDTSKAAADRRMVDLFTIDGTTYQIPAKPRVSVALRYLWGVKTHGEDRAAADLLEGLLGVDGFAALVQCDELEADDFERIMTIAQKVTMGALEQSLGGSGRGSSK